MTSTTRRSNFFVRALSKPVSPSAARSTAKPDSLNPFERHAAVFFSSSTTRMRICTSALRALRGSSFFARRDRDHQTCEKKRDFRRKKAVTTIGVQQKGLDIQ